ncbi:hypothetical protein GE061_001132 [Apolygus lucorum]|uniref:Uncharacterized protein n=1 Tax=Apolygus lucorum TaxID=248454 RepID=A0A8S9Y667_APOLU|nr:hypothetical protein GE061_001132 [Apolygus lucorum]
MGCTQCFLFFSSSSSKSNAIIARSSVPKFIVYDEHIHQATSKLKRPIAQTPLITEEHWHGKNVFYKNVKEHCTSLAVGPNRCDPDCLTSRSRSKLVADQMADPDLSDSSSESDEYDGNNYDSDVTEEVVQEDVNLMSNAALMPRACPTADDSKDSMVVPNMIDEANLELLEACPEIRECADPSFELLNPERPSSMISSSGLSSPIDDYLEEPKDNNNCNSVATPQPPVNESSARKRPHDELYDIQPGQWVAVSFEDDGVIPAMYIKEIRGKVEVKMVTPMKSGYWWGEKKLLDCRHISCVVDPPQMRDQVGSKSRPKRDVFYF